ncbi:hypothetical protein KI387_012835, partial [Taxus chinensis]
ASSNLSDQPCKHGDVYDFLENIGIIPCGKEESSSEFHQDENLYGEMDDTGEYKSSDAIFVDSRREKGMANLNKDSMPSGDLSAKFPNQIDGNAKTSSLSGWEASQVSDSQTNGWACNSQANEKTSDRKSGSQSKVAIEWDTNSTLVNDSANAIIFDVQESGWNSNVHSPGKRDFKSSWPEDTVTDVRGQNLRSDAIEEVNSLGGCENQEICSARKDANQNCMLESQNKCRWESAWQEAEVENSSGWRSDEEIAGFKSKLGKKQGASNSQEGEVTNVSSWNSNPNPERERHCAGGWTKDVSYSKSKEDGWKCHDQKNVWEVDLQESYVPNDLGWNKKVETAGGSNCTDSWRTESSNVSKDEHWKSASISKKRAAETDWNSNYPAWVSKKDSTNIKDCTNWNNLIPETIHQEEITKVHDNEQNPSTSSRFQKCIIFQRKRNRKNKNVEAENNMQCRWRQNETALQAIEDPDFPPGFPSVKDSYKENTVSLQQIENDTSFPTRTDISKSSRWKDYANEQVQHDLSISVDIKSDDTLKSKRTGANLVPLGKRVHSGIQCQAQNKNTSQDIEQNQRTSEEAQATGWSVEWQADVQETSWTPPQTRVIEAQATGWSGDWHTEVSKTSWTTPETMAERPGENRSLEKNVFEQDQVGHDNTKEPSSAGNLASPLWATLTKREQNKCKPASSGSELKFKPTGANVVPIGTRSHRRDQPKAYERNPVEQAHVQYQVAYKETPQKEWGINCHVEEGHWKSCTAGESDGKCKHEESNTQKVLLLGENSSSVVDLHVSTILGKDTVMNSNSNMETKKNFAVNVTEHGLHGWNPRPETISVRSNLERWNNEQVACHSDPSMTSGWEIPNQSDPTTTSGRGIPSQNDTKTASGWELPSQSDPPTSSVWELPNQSDPPTTSGWGLQSQSDPPKASGWEVPNQSDPPTPYGWEIKNCSADRPNEKLCMIKNMEDMRPSNDKSAIFSLRSSKRDRVHVDHKNLSPRSTRITQSLKERVIDRPAKLQEILHEINPLMHSMRTILHYNSYKSGDRLRPEDEREVLEKVFIHHPDAEAKMGCGVDFIMVDNHTEFSLTRCFYIVRKDGTRTDFSYFKCLKRLVEKKFPDSAKDFIEKYLKQSK